MYTKELDSYKPKTADSEQIKELGSKKNIKTFPPNYQLFIKAAKKLLYEGAKSVFLSFYQLATFDYLKSEDKTEHTSIRYWFRMLFLRKRAWEYRLEGLIEVVPFLMLFLLFDRKERRRVFRKIVLYIPFGDVNSVVVAESIDAGTWKKEYNSKYESVLAFLLFDPVGRLAQDFPYKDSNLSCLGAYSDMVTHETIENKWLTSEFDPRIQWRLFRGDKYHYTQHRYLSDEEIAKTQKKIPHKQKEKK
jgi:hypothetical protein